MRFLLPLRHRTPHQGEVERSDQAQGPGKRPPLLGEVEATRVGVHGRSPARQASCEVRDQAVLDSDDAQQSGWRRPFPAPHAGADRARTASHVRAYRSAGSADAPDAPSVSLWMSIRHPVRRAASRAFWPSLPIASESW